MPLRVLLFYTSPVPLACGHCLWNQTIKTSLTAWRKLKRITRNYVWSKLRERKLFSVNLHSLLHPRLRPMYQSWGSHSFRRKPSLEEKSLNSSLDWLGDDQWSLTKLIFDQKHFNLICRQLSLEVPAAELSLCPCHCKMHCNYQIYNYISYLVIQTNSSHYIWHNLMVHKSEIYDLSIRWCLCADDAWLDERELRFQWGRHHGRRCQVQKP